jgi:hypothetical protein
MRQLGAILSLTFALALAFVQIANAEGVDRTFVVGDEPLAMAVDPTDGRIFVGRTQGGSDHLVAIDPLTGQTQTYVTTSSPNFMAIDPVHRRLYVSEYAGFLGSFLDVFDLTTMTIEATLPIGGFGIAVDPATQRIYVVGGNTLSVIDGATNTVVDTTSVPDGQGWFALAIDPSAHHIYVSNTSTYYDGSGQPISRSLVILDDRDLSLLADVTTNIRVRWGIAVDHARHRVFLAQYGSSTVVAVDTSTLSLADSVSFGGFTGGIALLPDGVYVTTVGTGYYVLDPDTLDIRRTVSTLPFQPLLPLFHPNGNLYLGGRELTGPDVVAAVSLGNHPPAISATSLSPAAPTTIDTLALAVTAADTDFATDPSGQRDPLTFTYDWTRNGAVIPGESAATLDLSRAGRGDRGDTITGYVTVRDPQGLTATANRSAIIVNSLPVLTVNLSNELPHTNDVLTTNVSAPDADGDAVNITYAWTRNGNVIPGANTTSLNLATQGDDGDVIAGIVTASDGHGPDRVARVSAVVVPSSGDFLAVKSEPGDSVGAGIEVLFTPANAEFHPGELLQGRDYVIAALQQATHIWQVDIAAPPGQALGVGTYTNAARAGSPRPAGTPGLDVTADSRNCNALTGQFEVNELEFSIYGELKTLDATFEQRCTGATAKLVGRIRIEVPVQTPGVTLPPGSITVPATGNFLYFNGEPGDYIYGGAERLFTAPPATMTSSMSQAGDYFRGRLTPDFWGVDIAAPVGEPLAVGSYIRATRASFRPAGSSGIDVFGDGRGCNMTTGKFDVNELTYADNGQILVFQATFEQHCESRFSPALYGRIRIENPAPGPLALPPGSIAVPTSGTFLYVNSQTGDFVGAGAEHLYTSPASSILGELSVGRDSMKLAVGSSFSEYSWRVELASAPGTPLAAGAYTRAVKAEFRPPGSPGIDVIGEGRGCFRVTGRFNVDEMSFWANGDLHIFQATFEYHCDGAVPALFGRLRFEALPPVTLGVTLREEGGVSKSGVVTISGTVSCSRNVAVSVNGTLSQPVAKRPTITGSFALSIDCVAPKTVWSATLVSDNGRFGAGQTTATVIASACESSCVTATATRGVKLNSAK